MRSRASGWVCAALIATAFVGGCDAEKKEMLPIGTRVVAEHKTPVRNGDQVLDAGVVARVYQVSAVDGNRVRLVVGSASGWVQSDDVVPLDQAIEYFTQEIQTDPNAAAYAHQARGMIWGGQGELSKALSEFNEAIRLDPNDAGAFHLRGNVWSARQDYDKALADLNEAIRLDPKNPGAYGNRASIWLIKQDYDKVLADLDEVTRLDPRNAQAVYDRGLAWSAKRDYRKALADFDEAIRLDSTCADAFAARAWLWSTCPDADLRNGKKAVESATRAYDLGKWDDTFHIEVLAAAYAEAGDFDKAIEFQQQANERGLNKDDRHRGEERLKLYEERKPYRRGAST